MRSAKQGAVVLLAVVLIAEASVAEASGRVALVVGNSAYSAIGRLPNPGNDAADMTAALRRLGFEVTTVRDADRVALTEALRTFTRSSAGADVSLVFYAGHGLEVDGVNYLVPVDARLERDTDVRFETVELDYVLAATTGAALRVVILDACRNNPLARSMQRTGAARSVSRGSFGDLDESLLGDETLVAYAAAAGTTAADGTGRNSPYTSALLSYLEQPLEIGLLFREVRARVLEATDGAQRPHEYASLLGEHYLRAAAGTDPRAVEASLGLDRAGRRRIQAGLTAAGFSPGPADGVFGPATRAALRGWQASRGATATGYLDAAGATALGVPVAVPAAAAPAVASAAPTATVAAAAAPPAAASAPAAELTRAEVVFWESMRESTSASDFEAYLSRWPSGIYAPLATNRLVALRTAESDPPAVESPEREPGEVFQDCPECPELVVIPAGTFRMGCVSGRDCEDDEVPVHEVEVSSFALGAYEVTFEEYDRFAAATGGTRPEDRGWGRGGRPVIDVSWEDATAYAEWLSAETGERYRLPSESEWEYAARAGSATRYGWGDDIGRNRANCAGCSGRWDDADRTAPTGSFVANAWGVHDMHGNVREWVEDCWHENYARAPRDGSAWTRGGDCGRRVLRGGSWDHVPRGLRLGEIAAGSMPSTGSSASASGWRGRSVRRDKAPSLSGCESRPATVCSSRKQSERTMEVTTSAEALRWKRVARATQRTCGPQRE